MFINMTTGQRKEDKHSDNKKVVNIRYFSNNSKAMKPDGYWQTYAIITYSVPYLFDVVFEHHEKFNSRFI